MPVFKSLRMGISGTIVLALIAYLCFAFLFFTPRSIYTGKIAVSTEVGVALSTGSPVLALESTIITHGMPYPTNTETAKMVEDLARSNGVCPATIAIVNGLPHIGLNSNVLDFLGRQAENYIVDGKNVKNPGNRNAIKVSRREIGYVASRNINGGTTVAATMLLAKIAGIKVFSTGGIGGAHKYIKHDEFDEDPFDISADLQELAMTNVCVVSAGPKAILNLQRTTEILETLGVPVVGYKTDVLPAFWSRSTNPPIKLYQSVETPEEAAALFLNHFEILSDTAQNGGMLLVNPIPEENALDTEYVDAFIREALAAADKDHITGKEITPYLLQKMLELTEGKSITANIALVKNNVLLGAKVAKSISETENFPKTLKLLNELFSKQLMYHKKVVDYIRYSLCVMKNPLFATASLVYYVLEKTIGLTKLTTVYECTAIICYLGLLFIFLKLFTTIAGENPAYERKRLRY